MTIQCQTVPLFSNIAHLKHGFTLRSGGVSEDAFASLNLGWSTGDDDELVQENYDLLAKHLAINPDQLVGVRQEHGKNCVIVDGNTDLESLSVQNADAMITQSPGIFLTIRAADCFPILFVDPHTRTLGVAHAGWRGTLAGVTREVFTLMQKRFGVSAQNVLVAIGPGISMKNFEVSTGVGALFETEFKLKNDEVRHGEQSMYLDLAKINARQLLTLGIPAEHIWFSGKCTYDSPKEFFSYRRDGKKSGRFIGFLGWAT